MSGGRLRIEGDTSQAIRSLGELEAKGTSVAASIGKSFQLATRMAGAGFKSLRQEVLREQAATARGEDAFARAGEQRRKRVRQAVGEDAQARGNAYRTAGRSQEDAEDRATKAAEKEADKRKRVAEREAAKKIREAKKAEEAATEAARKEGEKRWKTEQTLAKKRLDGLKKFATGALTAGVDILKGLHSDTQQARTSRASPERQLNLALVQTGANRNEAQARMARLTQFAAQSGISTEELAGSANAVQGEFASLGDRSMTSEGRSALFEKFLARARRGRNLGADVGEYTRFAGMLDSIKMDEGMKDKVLSFSVGASQKGAVELGDVTKEAMAAMQGRIQLAMATNEKNGLSKPEAMDKAIRQTYSELQVAKSMGMSPRAAGNIMLAANTALQNDTQNEKMANNLQVKFGKGNTYQKELFNVGKGGKRTLKNEYRDALALSQKLSAMGMTTTDISNVFGPGGHGNPQSLQANWRRLVGGFAGKDAEGVTYGQRVKDLMDPSTAITAEQEKNSADIMENDSQSQLTRNEESKLNAFTDNTTALNKLSSVITDWVARHPVESAIGGAVLGKAAPALLRAAGAEAVSAGSSTASVLGRTIGGRGATGLLGSAGRMFSGPVGIAAAILLESNKSIVSGEEEKAQLERQHQWSGFTSEQRRGLVNSATSQLDASGTGGQFISGRIKDKFAENERAAMADPTFAAAIMVAIKQGMESAKITVAPATVEQARSASAGRTPNTAVQ